jgi:hypothetical protein
MATLLSQLFITTLQSRTQLMLKFLEISKLLPDIDELCLQSTPHGRAWLQTASPQIQQTPNLAELESQALNPAYEG